MDYTEDERASDEEFKRLYDKKSGVVDDHIVTMMRTLVNSCTKRVPKKRPRMLEV